MTNVSSSISPELLRERVRLTTAHRELEDALKDLAAGDLVEVLVHLSAPAEALFRAAGLVLKRPFGM